MSKRLLMLLLNIGTLNIIQNNATLLFKFVLNHKFFKIQTCKQNLY